MGTAHKPAGLARSVLEDCVSSYIANVCLIIWSFGFIQPNPARARCQTTHAMLLLHTCKSAIPTCQMHAISPTCSLLRTHMQVSKSDMHNACKVTHILTPAHPHAGQQIRHAKCLPSHPHSNSCAPTCRSVSSTCQPGGQARKILSGAWNPWSNASARSCGKCLVGARF